ncbi:helitron helicase-like domain-containing protein [Tanacetum coccineum]
MEDVEKVVMEMKERKIEPDLVTYATIIKGYVKADCDAENMSDSQQSVLQWVEDYVERLELLAMRDAARELTELASIKYLLFFVYTPDGNKLVRGSVQIVNVGTAVQPPLYTDPCQMAHTNAVGFPPVFERLRNMQLDTLGSQSVRQSVPIIHHVSVSTVDEQGCVHTRPLTTGALQETSGSWPIRGPDGVSYVGSSSTVAPFNHAYLCLDVTDAVVRPQIVPFTSTMTSNVYEQDGHIKDTHDGTDLFEQSEALPTTTLSHESDFTTCSTTQSSIDGHTPSYIDLGDCDQQCNHCGCLFWYGERIRGNNYVRRPEYHLCCGGGKIYMRPPPDPPVFIQQLLTNTHFMDHIRAYNQMFAMTSFGAKVDDSVNNGKGPYVFKVSGQIYHWIGSLCPEEGAQ